MSIHQEAANPVVFLDADNTLWDTDRVFADAQIGLLDQIEHAVGERTTTDDRLGYIRSIDQDIAGQHHSGLRYPPRMLAQAVGLAVTGMPGPSAARAARLGSVAGPLAYKELEEVESNYLIALKRRPALRTGVRNGIEMLHEAGCRILIVSEATRSKVEATAEALGLVGHFSRVIEGRKRPELYTRILRLIGSPTTAHMVGDQLDRDIAPARAAGLTTIYFPGGFAPRWAPDEATVKPDFRIGDFREVAGIVLGRTP